MAQGNPADTPAAITRWRQRLEPNRVATAWAQMLLRAAGKAKFSRAEEMLFDRIGLEQATDEVVAHYKAQRFNGMTHLADLCAGIGGDTLALANEREVVAVDWSSVRLAIAEHNTAVYGRRCTTRVGDVAFDWPDAQAVHIDPDRRPSGRRRRQPDACSPGLDVLQRIVEHYHNAAIKLSPGADLNTLPFDAEIELISHHGECKQAVVWTGSLKRACRTATVLPTGESISATDEQTLDWPPPRHVTPGCILFEPNPAVIRANLVGVLAHQHNLAPLDPCIAYLIGHQPLATSLLQPFHVVDAIHWSLKNARTWLADHDIGKLEIKTRGFAAKPEDLQHRLKLRGHRQAVLFLTRVGEEPIAILAERQAQNPLPA